MRTIIPLTLIFSLVTVAPNVFAQGDASAEPSVSAANTNY